MHKKIYPIRGILILPYNLSFVKHFFNFFQNILYFQHFINYHQRRTSHKRNVPAALPLQISKALLSCEHFIGDLRSVLMNYEIEISARGLAFYASGHACFLTGIEGALV